MNRLIFSYSEEIKMSKTVIALIICGLMLTALAGVSNAGVKVYYDGSEYPETTGSTVIDGGTTEFTLQSDGSNYDRSLEVEGDVTYLHTDNTGYATPSQSYYEMGDLSGVVLDYSRAYTIECRLRINNYAEIAADTLPGAKVFSLAFNEPDSDYTGDNPGKEPGGLQMFTLEVSVDDAGQPNGLIARLRGQNPDAQDVDPEAENFGPVPLLITDPENWHTYTIKVWTWDGLITKTYNWDTWEYEYSITNDYRTTTLYVDSQRSGASTQSAQEALGEGLEFGAFYTPIPPAEGEDPEVWNMAKADYDVDYVKVTTLATAEPTPGAIAAFEGGPNDEMIGPYNSPSNIGPAGTQDGVGIRPDGPVIGGAGSVHLSDGTTTAFQEIWSWSGERPKWNMHYMIEENGAWYSHIDMGDTLPGAGTNMYWTSYNTRAAVADGEYDLTRATAEFEKFFGQISVDQPYSLEWRFRFENFSHPDVAYDDYYDTSYWSLQIDEPGDHYPGDGDFTNTGHLWILGVYEAVGPAGQPAKVIKFNRGYGNWFSGNSVTYDPNDPDATDEGGAVIELNKWYTCRMVVEARQGDAERVAKLYVNGKYACAVTWEDEQWFRHYNSESTYVLAEERAYLEFGNFSNAKPATVDWDLDYMRTGLSGYHDCDDVDGVLAGYSGGVNLPFDVAAAEAASTDGKWRYPNVLDEDSVCIFDGSFTDFTRYWNGASDQVVDEMMLIDNEGMDNEVDYFHCNAMDTNHPGDNLYYGIDDLYQLIPVMDADKGYTVGWRMRVNDYTYNDPSHASVFTLQVNEPDDTGADNMGGVWTVALAYDETVGGLVAKIATSGWGDGIAIDDQWHEYKLKVYTTRPQIPGEAGTRMARLYVDGEAVYASTNGITPVAGSGLTFGTPGVTAGYETGVDFDLDYLRTWIDGVPTDCEGARDLGYGVGDVNKDCSIDIDDLAIVVEDWLKCIVPDQAGCEEPWM